MNKLSEQGEVVSLSQRIWSGVRFGRTSNQEFDVSKNDPEEGSCSDMKIPWSVVEYCIEGK